MTRRKPIKLASPYITQRMENEVLSVLRSGWLVAGPKVAQFEQLLCVATGRKHAIAVSSGTGALVAAMAAMDVGPESTVVVPAFTFPAPACAAAFLGAKVKLCDVDERTMNLSAESLKNALDDNVSLVIGIDQFGAPCPADEIEEICRIAKVPFLVDAACSIGSSLHDKPCGSFGDAAIFSFHPRKVVTTGEGGAVLTDDAHIAAKVRHARSAGLGDDIFKQVGFNFRPSEMGAAIGCVQLELLNEMIGIRRKLMESYHRLPFSFQKPIAGALVNYQTVVAVLPTRDKMKTAKGDNVRQSFLKYLREQGIEGQVGSYHLAQMDWLIKQERVEPTASPISAMLHDYAVSLPMHCTLSELDINRVVEASLQWFEQQGAE